MHWLALTLVVALPVAISLDTIERKGALVRGLRHQMIAVEYWHNQTIGTASPTFSTSWNCKLLTGSKDSRPAA
jgi:hypothetical protein